MGCALLLQESVDTPLVERRSKNWFQRQLQRMGSVRSSSTTYSSAGMAFASGTRPRHNSVYSQVTLQPGPSQCPRGTKSDIL